jgi:putative transposase
VSSYRLIAAEKANHSVALMCRVLSLSRSGFYAWQKRPASERSLTDRRLRARIRALHVRSGGRYGSPRLHAALRREGIRVSRKRVERLMRSAGLSALRRKRRPQTTLPLPGLAAADLVQRDFSPPAANRLWVADITYVPSGEGWLYLAVVLDCYSRRVVGWSLRSDLQAELVVDALEMALARRRPQPGLIHHSDRGSQYLSLRFGRRCQQLGIDRSLAGTGYDNAVSESFFASYKKELVHRRSFQTRREARSATFRYLEGFYNTVRLHSTLGYRPPAEYERMERAKTAKAA